MSDFLTELRGELLDAHAAYGRRRRRVRALRNVRSRLGLWPFVALPAVLCMLSVLAVLGRDARTGEPGVVAEIRIGGVPSAIAYAGGSFWISDYTAHAVVRVDADSRRVETRLALGGTPEAISAGPDDSLWIRVGRSGLDATDLVRMDATSGRILLRVAIGPDAPLAVTPGAAWAGVLATDDNRPREGLYRIDATTGTRSRLPITGVGQLAAGHDALWALRTNGDLIAVDPRRGRIAARLRSAVPAAGATAGRHALAVSGDDAWALSTTPAGVNELVHARSDAIVARDRVSATLQPLLATDGRALLSVAANRATGRFALAALDPADGRITATVPLGEQRPVALGVAPGQAWIVAADGHVTVVEPLPG